VRTRGKGLDGRASLSLDMSPGSTQLLKIQYVCRYKWVNVARKMWILLHWLHLFRSLQMQAAASLTVMMQQHSYIYVCVYQFLYY
jgi:hypothetical protein